MTTSPARLGLCCVQEFYKDAEAKRQAVMKEMAALSRELKQVTDGVAKAKRRSLELLASLRISQVS